ncbi:MAG: DUF1292 domain-containing protein [Clostridiaceae bacterium]
MENGFEDKIITLTDEDGNEVDFELIAKLDLEDEEYAVVVPLDEDTDEAIALKIDKDEDGEMEFSTVEDEEILNMISEAYEILVGENAIN